MQDTIRALVVAPYEGLKLLVQSLQDSIPDIQADIQVGNMDTALDYIRCIDTSRYDVIISRGGTATLAAQYSQTLVVSIEITSYDIMHAIALAQGFSGKSAIVGYRNITDGANAVLHLLNERNVEVFPVDSKNDLSELLNKLINDGYRTVIGDVIATETARARGLNAILITSSVDSVRKAFYDARRICGYVRAIKLQNKLLHGVLSHSAQRIVVFGDSTALLYDSHPSDPPSISNLLPHMERINAQGNFQFMLKQDERLWSVLGTQITAGDQTVSAFFITPFDIFSSPRKWFSVVEHATRDIPHINAFHRYRIHLEECLPYVEQYNRFRVPITIIGEVGTGKGYLASAIHDSAKGESSAIFSLDCELATEDDFQSLGEKFASIRSLGFRPTLYIQKLWALSLSMQRILAAALDDRFLDDVRVIAALRENPDIMLSKGIMLEALTSRLSTHHIYIPNLRDRPENVRELSSQFIIDANLQYGKQVLALNEESVQLMRKFFWPANLAQMYRVINQLVLMCKGDLISADSVKTALQNEALTDPFTQRPIIDTSKTLDEFSDYYIKLVLDEEHGNLTNAAKRLNIGRSTLWRKVNKTH